MGNKKKSSYSDINKKYSFLNEGVEGLNKKRSPEKKISSNEKQEQVANQNRKRRQTLREEKRRIMKEQRELGHTVKLNPQEIEFERRRLEQIKKKRKAEELRKKKRRNHRIIIIGVSIILVILLAVVLKNALARRAQANEQAANQNTQIRLEEQTQQVGNTDSTQLLGFNKTGEELPIYKEANEDNKFAEIPQDVYVKNFGQNGEFTKIKYLDQEGYVKTSGLKSLDDSNQLKVINGVLLVNDMYSLPQDYDPGLDVDAQKAFGIMVENAKADNIVLKSASDYRNYSQQTKANSGKVNDYGEYKADSKQLDLGTSEHQTGLAYDIMGEDYDAKYAEKFAESKEAKWLRDNAYKYGFIERFPQGKESQTNRRAEPWHYRYVGVEIAQKIFEGKLTLEEYLNESTGPTTIESNIERPEIKEETNTETQNNNETETTGSETRDNNQNTDGDNTNNSGTNNQRQNSESETQNTPSQNQQNTQNNVQENSSSSENNQNRSETAQ
ncbi:MAG: M15 family metallopeptidase [Gallicola sp.]|nr:M15 family metallopeptidase [Gallicola sp.]